MTEQGGEVEAFLADVDGAAPASGAPPDGPPVRFRLPDSRAWHDLEHSTPECQTQRREELRGFLLASLQLQHTLVLAGSGTSLKSGGPTMQALYDAASKIPHFEETTKAVNYAPAAGKANIEELLSRCDALLQLRDDDIVGGFRNDTVGAILAVCRSAGTAANSLVAHKELLRRLARRRARDSRFKLFTVNYDRCFEMAAGELGLVPIDGFSFSQPRRFDPRFFEYDIVRRGGSADAATFVPGVFQYFKLHGSVDWARRSGRTEIDGQVDAAEACLIYPAQAKFQRSYEQPHLELMAQYLAALREPNTCLVSVGFGFGDDHLCAPIFAALDTNPHFRLVVVDPEAERRLQDASGNWGALGELAQRTDVAFIAATFENFVHLVPDLLALSPAQELARAVRVVAGKA